MIINNCNLNEYDILSFSIFNICCIIAKYILNSTDKKVYLIKI